MKAKHTIRDTNSKKEQNKSMATQTCLRLSILMLMVLMQSSCAVNIARTNARIQRGFHGGVGGTIGSTVGGTDRPSATSPSTIKGDNVLRPSLQGNIGYGGQDENEVRADIQLKAGLFSATTVDLFVSPPQIGSFYYGAGIEAGTIGAMYISGTQYLTTDTFVTATGRVGYDWTDWDHSGKNWVINPQLAFGWGNSENRNTELSIFTGYTYTSGRGMDYTIDIAGMGDFIRSNHFIYAGAQLNF